MASDPLIKLLVVISFRHLHKNNMEGRFFSNQYAAPKAADNLCNGLCVLDHFDEAGLWSSGHAAIGDEAQVQTFLLPQLHKTQMPYELRLS